MIRAILTDLGNVIAPFDGWKLAAKLQPFAPGKTVEDVWELIWGPTGVELLHPFERGEIAPRKYFEAVRELLGAEIEEDVFWPIHIQSQFTFDQDVIFLWKALKAAHRGMRLIALTNVDPLRLEYIVRESGLAFDGIAASCYVGHMKPHVAVYDKALALARCAAHECLYVDDLIELVAVADHLGIRSHHYRGVDTLMEELRRYELLP